MRQTTTVGTALRLSGVGTDFAPWMALTVLPAAMNAFVVQLMEQGTRYGSIARHASEKALWGYCSLHHLLLALAAEPWDALAAPLLAEAMARNVMWVEREVDCYREDYRAKLLTREGWFQRTLTSKRLLMF